MNGLHIKRTNVLDWRGRVKYWLGHQGKLPPQPASIPFWVTWEGKQGLVCKVTMRHILVDSAQTSGVENNPPPPLISL